MMAQPGGDKVWASSGWQGGNRQHRRLLCS